MAQCVICDSKGWLLSVDRYGMCEECAEQSRQEIRVHVKAISSALNQAKSSSYHPIIFNKLGSAENSCRALLQYDRLGIKIFETSVQEFLENLRASRPALVEQAIQGLVEAARQKAQDSATDVGKLGGYAKAIDAVQRLREEIEDESVIDAAIIAIRAERDALKAKLLCRKAEVQLAKNKKSKALDHYIEAYMALKHDGTDDLLQGDLLAGIGGKITELGGELPD